MGFYFPIILLLLTVFTGIVSLFSLFMSKAEREAHKAYFPYKIIKLCREFFWVFFVVFIIRSFIVQPYIVPTGSLEPTILPGDLLLANEFYYGLRFPVWHFKMIPVSNPERGQIFLFRDPVNPKNMLIKRVIGVPGDTISYINKVLYINGKEMKQTYLGPGVDVEPGGYRANVKKYQEDLGGVIHDIFINPDVPAVNFYDLKVPKGHYFAMGDNRDDSDDSRYWGFVSNSDVVGKAGMIFMSWDSNASFSQKIRWHRIGTWL